MKKFTTLFTIILFAFQGHAQFTEIFSSISCSFCTTFSFTQDSVQYDVSISNGTAEFIYLASNDVTVSSSNSSPYIVQIRRNDGNPFQFNGISISNSISHTVSVEPYLGGVLQGAAQVIAAGNSAVLNFNQTVDEVRLSSSLGNAFIFTNFRGNNTPIPPLSTTISSQTNVSCFGESNGSATVNTTGGISPYNYVWSNGSLTTNSALLTNTLSGLIAGTYTVTVTDGAFSTSVNPVTITEPSALSGFVVIDSNVSTNGGSNGMATAIASGGVSPYSFIWSNAATTSSISGLTAGTYTVTITDSNSCEIVRGAIISQPTLPLSTTISSQTNVNCFGESNGAATVSISNGTPPYDYLWSNGLSSNNSTLTTNTISGLIAGTYTVTVTDMVSTTSVSSVTISEPSALSATASTNSPIQCKGEAGGATVSESGGTSPYTYQWSNGDITQSISEISSGSYTVTVTDNNGCTATSNIILTEPNALEIPPITIDANPTCNGLSDGALTAAPQGGVTPYTYLWTTAATTASISGLAAGTYTVEVTDANGCTAEASRTIFNATSTSSPITQGDTAKYCSNDSVLLTTTAVTGTTYEWQLLADTGVWDTIGMLGFSAGQAEEIDFAENNGVLYVAFRDGDQGNRATVMKFDGTAWVLVGAAGFSSSTVLNITLEFNSSNTPYVGFDEPGRSSVMSFDGSAWQYVGTPSFSGGRTDFLLVNDVPIIAFRGDTLLATVQRFDGTNWVRLGSGGISSGSAQAFQLAYLGGELYLSYSDNNFGSRGSVKKYDGTNWVTAGNEGFTFNQVSNPFLELYQGNLIFCYEGGGGDFPIRRLNGTFWSFGLPSIDHINGFNLDFEISNGVPYATYYDFSVGQKAILQRYNGNSWDILTPNGLSPGSAEFTSIEVVEDIPYVAFKDNANGGRLSVMKFNSVRDSLSSGTSFYASKPGKYILEASDASGCIGYDTIVVEESLPLTAFAIVSKDVSCNGGSDGRAIASASGDAPFSYLWSTSTTGNTDSTLTAGSHFVTITDGNGCSAIDSIIITEPNALTLSNITSDLNCFGDSSASIKSIVSGGTQLSGYAIDTTRANFSPTLINGNFVSLSDDDFTGPINLGFTFNFYGTDYTSVYIASNGFLSFSGPPNDLNARSSQGMPDTGSANNVIAFAWTDLDASAGGSVEYAVDGVAPNRKWITTFSNVPYFGSNNSITSQVVLNETSNVIEIHTIHVDFNSDITLGIENQNGTLASVYPGRNNTLWNASNDFVSFTPLSNPYTYSWSNGATTDSIINLSAGTYTVTVTDANGCTITNSTTFTEPNLLVTSANLDSNVTCAGFANGGASASIVGGNSPYSYLWSNTATTASITNVSGGLYYVSVTDGNSCMSVDSVFISEPLPINSVATVNSNNSCSGSTDGSASVSVSGGLPPFNYSWSESGNNTIISDSTTVTNISAGVYVVTITDSNSCSILDSVTIITLDTINPIVAIQNINVYLDSSGLASITVSDIDNGSIDNCSIQTLSIDSTNFDCSKVGSNTVNLTAIDGSGNTSIGSATVNLIDTIRPTVITQNITVYLDASGSASITTADIDNGTSDNCGILNMFLDSTTFNCSKIGTNTVTLFATDVNGNIASSSASVMVLDTIRPTLATQNVTVYLNSSGFLTITAADIDNGSTDNCGIAALSIDSSSFDCSDIGLNTIKLFATDVNGNIDSSAVIVTVLDTSMPIAAAKDITVYLDVTGSASITAADIDDGSTDNCNSTTLSVNKSSFNCSDVGLNTVILSVTDIGLNGDSASATVTVIDTLIPTISNCPANISVTTDIASCNAVVNWVAPTAADNCVVDSLVSNFSPNNIFPIGTTTVTYISYDAAMNTDTCSFTITVTDAEAPVINGTPSAVSVNANPANCSAIVNWIPPTATDNCTLDSLVSNFNPNDAFPIGTTAVTYIAYDNTFNTDTVNFTVTVIDNIAPVISGSPSAITVNNDAGNCSAAVNWILPTATDNCTVDSLISNFSPNDVFPIGTTTVTYIAYDPAMNTDTINFTVTVVDNQDPVISGIPASININNDAGSCSATVNWTLPTAVDNCSIDSLVGNFNPNDLFPIGITTVTYIAYDPAMNTDTVSFTITVTDNEAPIITCPSDITICDQLVTFALPTAIDNCQSVTITQITGLASGVNYPFGITINTFVAEDASGNKDTCSFTVSVSETPSLAIAGNDTTICETTLPVIANSITTGSGLWTSTDASITFLDNTNSTTTVSNLKRGANTLIWTVSNGVCSPNIDTLVVTVDNDATIANAGSDVILCEEGEVTLSANTPLSGTGVWSILSGNGLFINANDQSTLVTDLNNGLNQFVWTITNGTCPSSSDTVNAVVSTNPTADAGPDISIFKEDGIQLNVNSNTTDLTYFWSPSFNIEGSNTIQSPFARPTITTEYSVEVTNADGCSNSDNIIVTVSELLTIPAAFTPDADGVNDVWDIKNTDQFESVEVNVYTGNGNEIFSAKNYDNPWDGKFNGVDVEISSYYYVIKIKEFSGETIVKTGVVSVLR